MNKTTLVLIIILLSMGGALSAQTLSPSAENSSSAQVGNRIAISAEIQSQIQEALSQRTISNNQTFNRPPIAATYVGSFNTNDGPVWTSNPATLSAVQAAAFIFGGSPSDYAISTNPNTTDPSTITETAWATTWGVGGCQEVAEDYFLDLGAPGYNDPGGANTATSAYVSDNCFGGTNYVWLLRSINCPGNITVSNDPGICGAVVNYTVTANDPVNGPLTPTQTAGLPSGSEFPVGVTTNTFEVTYSNGTTDSCSFDVTVNDTEAPVITCPGEILVDTDAGVCGATVAYDVLATDNCTTSNTVVYQVPLAQLVNLNYSCGTDSFYGYNPSGGIGFSWNSTENDTPESIQVEFTVGVECASGNYNTTLNGVSNTLFPSTPSHCFCDGQAGAASNVSFSLNPSGYNPGGQNVLLFYGQMNSWGLFANGNYGAGIYAQVTVTYNTLAVTQIAGLPSGSVFPVGTTTNTFETTDSSGNTASCSFDVIVNDNEAPTAVCQNITVELDGSGNAAVVPADIDGGSTDNCAVDTIEFLQTFTAFAEVNEGQNLTITLPAGNVVSAVDFASYGTPNGSNGNYTIGGCHASNSQTIVEGYALGNNTFTIPATNAVFGDPCGGTFKRLYVTVSYSTINNSMDYTCANVGDNNVTILVTDVNGNTATCTAVVTVEDNEAPIITCVPDSTRNTDLGVCQYTVVGTEFDATFTDNCSSGTITNDFNGTATLAGDILPKGDTTVVWTVNDGNGQTATCTTVITVEDNEDPIITCVPNATRNTDLGVCQYTVVGTEFDATFTDNCSDGSITNDFNGTSTLAGEVLPKGDTTVVWTVNDGNGQTATCTTLLTIEDNENPTITCVPNATRDTDPGVCQYTVVGTEFDATFTDNCSDGSITNDFNGTATLAGEILPTGDTTVVWTVNDGNGQTATCTTVITIDDNEVPIIVCPANINANTDAGNCFATVSFSMPIALDNCGIDTVVQTAGLPSGSQFPVGINTVEFTATDINGNTSTCSFTITVIDNEAPVAVCQNITIQLDANGNASITAADVDGGSTDQCGIASTTIDMDTFDCSNVGDNNVILTVTDVNGNTSTCTAIVTVEDVTAPVVACRNIIVELDPVTGTVTIAGTDIDNGSTDACGIDTYTLDIDTFDCSDIGDNTVVLTVTDVNGNTATCTAIVTVEDNTPPVLVCQDFTIEIGADGTATLSPSDVIASNDDACGILTVAVDITEFSCADIGTPVTVQVFSQDNNGNLATCTATVTAVDVLAPVITCPADQTVDPGAGNLFYIVPDYFATGEATAIDNCTDPVTVTTQDPAAGTALTDGTYTITLTATDEYGNTATCEFELIVESVLGTGDNSQSLGSIAMYPNPVKENVTIGNPQSLELESAHIYDLTGRLVQTINLQGMGNAKIIDVSQLSAATYLVIINGKEGQLTKRLMKE